MSRRRIRLEDLYDSLQDMSGKVDALTAQLHVLTKRQQTLAAKVDNVTVEQKSFKFTLDNLTAGYVDFRAEFKELRGITIAGFDTMTDRFDRVESRVDQLEAALA